MDRVLFFWRYSLLWMQKSEKNNTRNCNILWNCYHPYGFMLFVAAVCQTRTCGSFTSAESSKKLVSLLNKSRRRLLDKRQVRFWENAGFFCLLTVHQYLSISWQNRGFTEGVTAAAPASVKELMNILLHDAIRTFALIIHSHCALFFSPHCWIMNAQGLLSFI